MKLICSVPEKEYEKFKYVLEVIFDEFLGLPYCICIIGGGDTVQISHDGYDGKLVIESSFLQKNIDDRSLDNLPKLPLEVLRAESIEGGLFKGFLPVLFGSNKLILEDEVIVIGVDILGGIFFLLSRYEELVIKERDEFGRFSASNSISFKAGILGRPLVDEYVNFLWACMKRLWPSLIKQKAPCSFFVSCDVDQPFDTTVGSVSVLLRTCFADLIKRRSIVCAGRRVCRYILNRRGDYRLDPFYTFDWYMDMCESVGLKAVFYFIPTSLEPNNGSYELSDKSIRDLLIKIDRRGHEIGVHGSFQTYRNGRKMLEQKSLLDKTLLELNISQKVNGNRQHYLRWDTELTPELLDQAGFQYDSTGGYADHVGFRFGTGREFSMWGWKSNRKLMLKQRPLVVMECTLFDPKYMGLGRGRASLQCITGLCKLTKECEGGFSLLWHNSSLQVQQERSLFMASLRNAKELTLRSAE